MFGRSRECGGVVKVFKKRNTSGRLGWGWMRRRDKVRVGME